MFLFVCSAHSHTPNKQLALRLFSRESIEAVKTIRSILQDVHAEHGVVDVFKNGRYKKYDILFAVLALNRLQTAARMYEERQQQRQPQQEEIRPDNPEDCQLLHDLAHYAVYANAVYGWKMDLLALRWRRLHLMGGGDVPALLRRTRLEPEDVVRAEWETSRTTHRPAYLIVRDHAERSIVLAIRGTWSPHDLLTDLCCLPRDFDSPHDTAAGSGSNNNASSSRHSKNCSNSSSSGSGGGVHPFSSIFDFKRLRRRRQQQQQRRSGHHGMLQAARAVQRDVQDILEAELLERHPDYNLVLVGHSLGGGVAALLGTLLEDTFPPERLRVYLYGAPCVAPRTAQLHPNIVSVVTDGDPFSRLSLGHVADVSVALDILCQDAMLRHDILFRTSSADLSDDDLQWCFDAMQVLRSKMTAEKLFPPGRILLLTPASAAALPPLWSKPPWMATMMNGDDSKSQNDDNSENNNNSRLLRPSLREVPAEHFRDPQPIGPLMVDLSRHIPTLYEDTLRALADDLQDE